MARHGAQFMRRRPCRCRDVGQPSAQSLHSFQAILDLSAFRFSERDLLLEALQIGLGLKQLSPARSFRHIERTFGASHAVWALVKKIITAVSVPTPHGLRQMFFLCAERIE